jgi:hypothetical protein
MKCSICSTNAEPGQQFCGFCGTGLKTDRNTQATSSAETTPEIRENQMLPAASFGTAISLGFQNFFNF